MKKHERKQLINKLRDEWICEFRFDYLNSKGKAAYMQLISKPEFLPLNSKNVADATGVNRITVSNLKKQINDPAFGGDILPKKHSGRPRKVSNEITIRLLDKVKARRSAYFACSLKWITHTCNTFFGPNNHVSRFTVRRLLKRNHWTLHKSVRKQAFCLTSFFEIIVNNWRKRLSLFLTDHRNITIHVMDESGIYTNMLPRSTFKGPDEQEAYVLAPSDTTKDTVIATLSTNGKGDLFYVPYRAETKEVKGCSGVGNAEMKSWADHFLCYASKGDLLIMDNLAAHRNKDAISYIKKHGIYVKFLPVRAAFKLSPLDNCFFHTLKHRLESRFNELTNLKGQTLREEKLKIIKEEFQILIEKGKGISYFKHCKYDKLGAKLGDSTETMFGQIPFSWQEDLGDTSFFPEDQASESLNLPKISTNKVGLRYASALLGFLLINQEYRKLIHASSNEIIKMLDASFPDDEQKSFSASLFFENATQTYCTLSSLIEFINNTTNNVLKYIDEKGEEVSLGMLTAKTQFIPKAIINKPLTCTPIIIAIDIEGNHFDPNESFPKMLVNAFTREQYYVFAGIIGLKLKDNTYFCICKRSDDSWVKYDKGWRIIAEEDLDDYYIDIGEGQAIIIFYTLVDNNSIDDDEPEKRRASLLQQIITLSEINCNETIVSNMKNVNSNAITAELPWENRYKINKKALNNLNVNSITGMHNPKRTCYINSICQLLFTIKDLVAKIKYISQCNHSSPIRELSIVFEELEKPFDGKAVSPRNLMAALKLNINEDAEWLTAFKLLLKKIDEAKGDMTFNVYKYFAITEPPYSNISSFIVDTSTISNDISNDIYTRLQLSDVKFFPPILIVIINRLNGNHYKKIIPRNLGDADGIFNYELFSITAGDSFHFCQFTKISDRNWIGIDDETGFDVKEEYIEELFGYDNNNSIFMNFMGRNWLAYVLFYKKVTYNLNDIEEQQ